MNTPHRPAPLTLASPPDSVDSDMAPLLSEPFAGLWAQDEAAARPQEALRGRLVARLAASRAEEAVMFTVRRRRLPAQSLGTGVLAQTLYLAQSSGHLRPGEPWRARLMTLAPGARLTPDQLGDAGELEARHREWLLVSGQADADGQPMGERDYRVTPAGFESPSWFSTSGALLFLRESDQPCLPGDSPTTVFDAEAGWPDYAPGVRRRVLWQCEGQAALLYCAQPGAEVPRHRHGHDEECLMVQGELYLDDLLLQPGDYQLAPAGSGHRITATDTGVVIYAHGDLDLDFVG